MGVSRLPRRWASREGREQRSAKASLGLSSELHSRGLQALRRGEQVATGGLKGPRLGSFVRAVVAGCVGVRFGGWWFGSPR